MNQEIRFWGQNPIKNVVLALNFENFEKKFEILEKKTKFFSYKYFNKPNSGKLTQGIRF
jgi:hypothetical protein